MLIVMFSRWHLIYWVEVMILNDLEKKNGVDGGLAEILYTFSMSVILNSNMSRSKKKQYCTLLSIAGLEKPSSY